MQKVMERPERRRSKADVCSALHWADDHPFFVFLSFSCFYVCCGSMCSMGSMCAQQSYSAVLHLHLWYSNNIRPLSSNFQTDNLTLVETVSYKRTVSQKKLSNHMRKSHCKRIVICVFWRSSSGGGWSNKKSTLSFLTSRLSGREGGTDHIPSLCSILNPWVFLLKVLVPPGTKLPSGGL